MQIRKDGAVVYNSIDNTGSTDDASLGARYAMGRLDTLDGRFDDYFDKAEVYDLLEQKSAAEFVDQLPGTLADNTWYYSKKFADGTDVPNDKRALYAKDAGGVTQYLGIIGDIDLSAYYTKDESDAHYEPLIEARVPLACDYDLITTPDPLQADACKFNFTKKQATFTRVTERRIFNAYAPDPVGGGSIWGVIEVKQMARSSGVVYIEQTFTRFQGTSTTEDGTKYQYRLTRKGFVTDITDPFTQVEGATVTWRPWRPLDYPNTTIYNYDGAYINAVVRGGMCYLDLGGNFNPRYTSGDQHIIGYVNNAALNPAREVHGTIQNMYGKPEGEVCTFWIQTNGEIKAFTMSDWTNIRGGIAYPLNY